MPRNIGRGGTTTYSGFHPSRAAGLRNFHAAQEARSADLEQQMEIMKITIANLKKQVLNLSKRMSTAVKASKALQANMTAAKTVQRSHAALLEAQSPSWAAIHEAAPKRVPGGTPPPPGQHRRPTPLQDPTTELILRGVPYSDSESHQALQDYIAALAQHKGLELRPTDYTALRALAKPALAPRRNGTHPKIIIKLSSNLLKTKLKARAKGEGSSQRTPQP